MTAMRGQTTLTSPGTANSGNRYKMQMYDFTEYT